MNTVELERVPGKGKAEWSRRNMTGGACRALYVAYRHAPAVMFLGIAVTITLSYLDGCNNLSEEQIP
jgi:hypothetical protein